MGSTVVDMVQEGKANGGTGENREGRFSEAWSNEAGVAGCVEPRFGGPRGAVLERLAKSLEREHPGAAASIREGLDETLTVQRLDLSSVFLYDNRGGDFASAGARPVLCDYPDDDDCP